MLRVIAGYAIAGPAMRQWKRASLNAAPNCTEFSTTDITYFTVICKMNGNDIPSQMGGWRKYEGNVEPIFEQIPVPETPAEGYLVKILAAGICHSDYVLLNAKKGRPHFNKVYTLGHEGCGVVARVGDKVGKDALKPGDRVSVFAVPGCGSQSCPECSRGLAQLCLTGTHHGIGQDGSFTEYVAAHARAVVPLPEGVPPAVGAVATDAVLTAYHAIVRRGGVQKGQIVAQFGLGGLGFNGLQILHALGVRVIVTEIREEALKAATDLGIPAKDIVPVGKSVQDFVNENGLEEKIDVVLDFVGTKETINDAQMIVRRAGTIVGIGTLSPETSLNMHLCIQKRISLLFNYGGQREDLVEVLDMISKGKLRPVVRQASMSHFPQVLAALHAGKIVGRVALVPEGVDLGGDAVEALDPSIFKDF